MKTSLKTFIFILICASLFSCTSKEPYQLPKNAKELLTGKTGKNWKIAWRHNNGTRMNMSGCFLSYRITYLPNKTLMDNNGDYKNCGESLSANWEIVTNKDGKSYVKWIGDQLSELLNTPKNYKYFKILKITEDTLELQHRHKQFSTESTFIDTYVTEHIKIKDRNFHR